MAAHLFSRARRDPRRPRQPHRPPALRWALAGLIVCGVAGLSTASGRAQAPLTGARAAAGDTLPGVERVPLSSAPAPGLSAAGGAAFGYTEKAVVGGHQQYEGDLAVGFSPLDGLAFAYVLRTQLDRNDEGNRMMMRSRVRVRYSLPVATGVRAGAQVSGLLPAATALGDALSGAGVSGELFGGYAGKNWEASAMVGLALDRGARAIGAPERLTLADRVSLEVSDPALLQLGLACAYHLSSGSVVGEWSWEPTLGKKAVSAFESPMWIRAGYRFAPSPRLSLGALVGVSPSQRPEQTETGPLQRVEARFWGGLRLVYAFAAEPPRPTGSIVGQVVDGQGGGLASATVMFDGDARAVGTDGGFRLEQVAVGRHRLQVSAPGYAPTSVPVSVGADQVAHARVQLEAEPIELLGEVVTPAGVPIPGARVSLEGADGDTQRVGDDGRFRFPDQRPGELRVRVEADGFETAETAVTLSPGHVAPLSLSLKRALPAGQIEGTVRGFDGAPIAATIAIKELDVRVTTDVQGGFRIEVPPGEYEVEVRAPGYVSQTRAAVVEERGVTVLLVDLRSAR